MEGIAGILYPNIFQANERIVPMLETMKHRGENPDTIAYKNLEIGICGGKIAFNERKSLYVCLDGFIYNRESLCRELKQHGYHLDCESDAKVLVYGYEHWGIELLSKLTGEFTIAILDKRKDQVLLARNRIGKKPLYWYQDQHHFIFASEMKGVLATGAVPQTPAIDALASYLYFSYIPQDMSPIKDINKLLPGYYLLLNLDGKKAIHSYWSYSECFMNRLELSKEEITENLDSLLLQCVKDRIPETEHVGCFISGGLGSASIAHYLKSLTKPNQLKAYTLGFEGENDEDMAVASSVADHLKIEHQKIYVDAKTFLDELVQIIWYMDEPLADPNIVSSWGLAKFSSDDLKTVFSGMGSDELLAGHSRYTDAEHYERPIQKWTHYPLVHLGKFFAPLLNYISRTLAYKVLKHETTQYSEYEYLQENALFPEDEIAKVSPRLAHLFDPELFLHKFHHLDRIPSNVSSYLYFDVKTRLPDLYILQFERCTAAFGMDWKAPFIDRRIVEFLASIPEPDVMSEADAGSYLKSIMNKVLPEEIVNRSKVTRKYFLESWLVSDEMVQLYKMLQKGSLVESGIISELWIRDQIHNIYKRPDAFRYLWAILVLEIWYRLYINHPIRTGPPSLDVRQILSER